MVNPHEASLSTPGQNDLFIIPCLFQSPPSILKSIIFIYYVYIYLLF